VGKRGGGDADAFENVRAGGGAIPGAEFLKDFVAAWVSQGAGNQLNLAVGQWLGSFRGHIYRIRCVKGIPGFAERPF
jgi:hypothetical protein